MYRTLEFIFNDPRTVQVFLSRTGKQNLACIKTLHFAWTIPIATPGEPPQETTFVRQARPDRRTYITTADALEQCTERRGPTPEQLTFGVDDWRKAVALIGQHLKRLNALRVQFLKWQGSNWNWAGNWQVDWQVLEPLLQLGLKPAYFEVAMMEPLPRRLELLRRCRDAPFSFSVLPKCRPGLVHQMIGRLHKSNGIVSLTELILFRKIYADPKWVRHSKSHEGEKPKALCFPCNRSTIVGCN
jgi:hypothetical protein